MAATEPTCTDSLPPQGTPVGFFSVMKSLAGQLALGTDITRVALPSIFCYPISLLEIIAVKRMRGMDQCAEIDAEENKVARILRVIKWIFSAITPDQFGKKPLNPISGETFECQCGDSYYFSEQVSHHPPISAFHFEHLPTGCKFFGHTQVIAKFGGNSVAATFAGTAFLHIPKYNETYHFSMPMPIIHACSLIIGSSHNELGGDIILTCKENNTKTHITFHTTGMFTGTLDRVTGKICEADESSKKKKDETLASFEGTWSGQIKAKAAKGNEEAAAAVDSFEDHIVFDYTHAKGVTAQILRREGVPDSRSVWGDTMDAIRNNDLAQADDEKAKVEVAQRERFLEAGDTENGGYEAKFFEPYEDSFKLKEDHTRAEAGADASGDGEKKKKKKKKKKSKKKKADEEAATSAAAPESGDEGEASDAEVPKDGAADE
eukprot:TRINITY_DN1383_c0_g2_i1.p1 TRINITY_DN1383_c0_g2~~TRINITY_DN1383_c0_g2_i1.p1  ORF type:complete len:452 (+),score=180.27 TRINITY_DN1383_c0_g2_i1:57-1358(+)